MQQFSRQTWFLLAVLVISFSVMGYMAWHDVGVGDDAAAAPVSRLTLQDIPFNGAQAYEYLKQICAIGTRVSGTPGMQQQQKLLVDHFQKAGGTVSKQEFRVRHPLDGSAVNMANIIVQWHPERTERILLCAHYDTRPYPDQDRNSPRGTFIGANDGASGAALLMQMAHDMPKYAGEMGVDFVLFDGEELVYANSTATTAGDPYFLGSEYFSRDYVARPPKHKYRWAVLLDMVADKDLQILQEINSMSWRDTRPLVQQIWNTAKELGVREFIASRGHEIKDDHLRLHNIAGIPACDVIDFDYPHWHTEADVPENCSALSLAKVGWVVREWMQQAKPPK